jgi:Alternative complex III, ActD subunit
MPRPPFYGLLAEFRTPLEVIEAAERVHHAGYQKVDAYSPYPIEALSEALGFHRSPLPKLVLAGGIVGLLVGYGLEYWASVIEYPMNIGGRPFHSWPAFIPPAFETTILFAAGAAVLGMLGLNHLPEPYHPVFNVPGFALATRDKFFICVEATDPKFDPAETRKLLESLGGEVVEVPH